MADQTCARTIYGSRSYVCDRPAKGVDDQGEPACGIHLGVDKRRAAKEAARARRMQAREDAAQRAEERVARIRKLAPELDARRVYTSDWASSGDVYDPDWVVVSYDALRDLLTGDDDG
jgi:hypothetical protein